MIKFTAELEDVVFTATLDTSGESGVAGAWTVLLSESQQAQKEFGRDGVRSPVITCEIVLNGEEMASLLFLAANGDECDDRETVGNITRMYAILSPKLTNVPQALRPIP